MRILFPTDFSEQSRKALPFALDICKRTGGSIQLFTAYDLPYGERGISMSSLLEAMKKNAEVNMKNFEQELSSENLSISTDVVMGNPIRLIRDRSKSGEFDIIVMGTHGASGIEEILIGSNAASVIENARIPVLVIPPKAEFNSFKHITFCSELKRAEDEFTLARLKKFALLYGAHIDILHIQHTYGEKGSREHLSSALEGVSHSFCLVKNQKLEEAVLQHAEEHNTDLIASMTKKYGFFEGLFHSSLTKKLAYHSHTPILALHKNE